MFDDNKIKNAQSVVIIGHKNMDGDALASVISMGHFCRNEFGKDPILVFEGVIPDNLRFLSNGWWLRKAEDIKDTVFDLAILLDTADMATMMDEEGRALVNNAKDRIKIDHHQNSKEIDGFNIILHMAATCEIITNIALEKNWNITRHIARFLYAGIYADTGGFVHDYVTPDCMRTVAKLMETGLDHSEIVRRINEKRRETF
ncbi:MAG: DHH family phosphoesterase, partial [Rickettsiales bacterium]|nr:DHH family phosphoesterase [Rickettsiales bacterium]